MQTLDVPKRRSPGSPHTQIASPTLADYLAVMSRAVFQAGLSWAAIDRQWDALCEAFDGFDPGTVALYRDTDVRRIMALPGILHSERKIEATIHNARTMLDLDREYQGFRGYLRSLKNYAAAATDLKQRFSHVGDISIYYFFFRVGEKVPPFTRWVATVKGDHPRIREMVAGRSQLSRRRSPGRSNKSRGRPRSRPR